MEIKVHFRVYPLVYIEYPTIWGQVDSNLKIIQ
jgi:hypothetical protein